MFLNVNIVKKLIEYLKIYLSDTPAPVFFNQVASQLNW